MRDSHGTAMPVSVHSGGLRRVTYVESEQRWAEMGTNPIELGSSKLERPFTARSVIAPGPRITAPAGWAQRHREFHVKPAAVLADTRSEFTNGTVGPVRYRIQVGMVFAPTPRGSSASILQAHLLGCHLAIELISEPGFTLGWEGPRWHLRYGEGMSLDGACPLSPQLVTRDEFAEADLAVDHPEGRTALSWTSLFEFGAFVNRFIDLGPETLLLAGWPSGPTLTLSDGVPDLVFDAPQASEASDVWAVSDVLGRVECRIGAQVQ